MPPRKGNSWSRAVAHYYKTHPNQKFTVIRKGSAIYKAVKAIASKMK